MSPQDFTREEFIRSWTIESRPRMTQDLLVFALISHSLRHRRDTFEFDQVYETCETDFRESWPRIRDLRATMRKCLQNLRDMGWVEFVDNRGTYRLLRALTPEQQSYVRKRLELHRSEVALVVATPHDGDWRADLLG